MKKNNFKRIIAFTVLTAVLAFSFADTAAYAAEPGITGAEEERIFTVSLDELLSQTGQTLRTDEPYKIVSPKYKTNYNGLTFCVYFWVTIGTDSDGSYRVSGITDWGVSWNYGFIPSFLNIIPSHSMTAPYYWGVNNDHMSSKVNVELTMDGYLVYSKTQTVTVVFDFG